MELWGVGIDLVVLVNDWLCTGERRGLNDVILLVWVCLERILLLFILRVVI